MWDLNLGQLHTTLGQVKVKWAEPGYRSGGEKGWRGGGEEDGRTDRWRKNYMCKRTGAHPPTPPPPSSFLCSDKQLNTRHWYKTAWFWHHTLSLFKTKVNVQANRHSPTPTQWVIANFTVSYSMGKVVDKSKRTNAQMTHILILLQAFAAASLQ